MIALRIVVDTNIVVTKPATLHATDANLTEYREVLPRPYFHRLTQ